MPGPGRRAARLLDELLPCQLIEALGNHLRRDLIGREHPSNLDRDVVDRLGPVAESEDDGRRLVQMVDAVGRLVVDDQPVRRLHQLEPAFGGRSTGSPFSVGHPGMVRRQTGDPDPKVAPTP